MRYSEAFSVHVIDPSGSQTPLRVNGSTAVFLSEQAALVAAAAQGFPREKVVPVPLHVVVSFEESDAGMTTAQRVDLAPKDPNDVGLMELAEQSCAIAKSKGFAGQSVPETMALFHSEISEAFEEWRNGHDLHEIYEGANGKPEGYPIELADLQIRIAHHVGKHKIDLVGAIRRKSAYNKSRPFKHGGKRV